MPMAVAAPIIGGIAAGAGSAAGGKKQSSAAKAATNLQQQQLDFGKQLANTAINSAWTPASNYWTALLKGGPAATTAVGPYAGQLRTQGTGALNAISSTLPAGGEKNLAMANTIGNTYSNIQRLTAGMQPTAATALGSLAGPLLGAGTNTSGQGLSLTPSLLQNAQFTAASTQQGAAGLGNLLYNAMNKPSSSGIGAPATLQSLGLNSTIGLGGLGIPGIGGQP